MRIDARTLQQSKEQITREFPALRDIVYAEFDRKLEEQIRLIEAEVASLISADKLMRAREEAIG